MKNMILSTSHCSAYNINYLFLVFRHVKEEEGVCPNSKELHSGVGWNNQIILLLTRIMSSLLKILK